MANESWVPNQGQLIDDRYELQEEIGRGGMGVVYRAVDTKLLRPVALKFLDPDLVSDAEAVGRFQREALTAGRIGHENICDVRDMGTIDGSPYIVMELLEGQPLSKQLRRTPRLPPLDVIEIVGQVLSALDGAHKAGVIHRDLKPENVFLTTGAGEQLRVKLVDFGISKFLGEAGDLRLTKTGVVMGSPYYMSPEQARGREDIDERSDLWAVGVLLFEMLTGQLPFSGSNYNEVMINIVTKRPPSLRDLLPDLPHVIDAFVSKALTKNRTKRFESARDFSQAMEAAVESCEEELDGLSISGLEVVASRLDQETIQEEEPSSSPARRRRTRSMALVVALVTACVVALGIVVGLLFAAHDRQGQPDSSASQGPESTESEGELEEGAPPTPQTASIGEAVQPLDEEAPEPVSRRERRAENLQVKLLGLPEGARVTFNGNQVEGAVLLGRPGLHGTLEVDTEDEEPLRLAVTLTQGLEIDVGQELALRKTSLQSSRRRHPAKTPKRSVENVESESQPGHSESLYVPGRAGSKIITTLERAEP